MPRGSFQKGLRLEQGVARTQLRLLQCKAEARPYLKGVLQLLGLMADDHHDRGGRKGRSGTKHVIDQREAGGAVQDFRQRGFHARALPGGQDHNVDV